MNEPNVQELEKVAEAYAELLAPALMEEWPHRVTDTAGIEPGQHVLDVGCGTGILARAVDERVGPTGSVSAVDINPGMLAVARRSSSAIDWREGGVEFPIPVRIVSATRS